MVGLSCTWSRHWSAKGAVYHGLELSPMIREAIVRRPLRSCGCARGRSIGRMLPRAFKRGVAHAQKPSVAYVVAANSAAYP